MTSDFDGIIIGAGHNSLILQAYLGRAGLKTLCLERRPDAGGGLTTVEDSRHPGFLHNTHAFFCRAIPRMPWFRDLDLAPGAGHYRGPFRGLYLCGSSSHPGGNVTGLPGYNAAQVIGADLGLDLPWRPEPIESRLARIS